MGTSKNQYNPTAQLPSGSQDMQSKRKMYKINAKTGPKLPSEAAKFFGVDRQS
jgi:hypothetical protein